MQKKRMAPIGLLCVLLLLGRVAPALGSVAPAFGEARPHATVDTQAFSRVQLREGPAEKAKVLGVYYTGTDVECVSSPSEEWVQVIIGSQTGYLKAEFLASGEAAKSVQASPAVKVVDLKKGGALSLRGEPTKRSKALLRLSEGDSVTLHGITADGWGYVTADGHTGYVLAEYLSLQIGPRQYATRVFTKAPNEKSSISVQYPRFKGEDMNALNDLILEKVRSFAGFDPNDSMGRPGLIVDYQMEVTLQNDRILSLIFWGTSTVIGSKHTYTDLIAFNVDMKTLEEISLTDLYAVDEDFEKVFFAKAFFPLGPRTSYREKYFARMLRKQTKDAENYSWFDKPSTLAYFLRPDGLVVSLPADHSTGCDHFEGQLTYADVQEFYMLPQNIWELR